jgi:uncharacterized membrane protein YhiD involved in acid resistance
MDPAQELRNAESATDLQRFLLGSTPDLPVWQFVPALLAAGLLCWLLGLFYERYGASLSNRASFSRNFPLVGMTTMLVIAIVKSSLALSLGLVGALSIVRFRTAIKEPEELAYLFTAIGIGLGFGANQWLVTTGALGLMLGALWIQARLRRAETDASSNLFLTVTDRRPQPATLANITDALKPHCDALDLRRFDEAADGVEVAYLARFSGYEKIDRVRSALHAIAPTINLTFIDQGGLH